MARYQKILPIVDAQANTFNQIHQLMTKKGYKLENQDGKQVFRKGDGFWTIARFLSVSYYGSFVHVEAWVDSMGGEMNLEGFVACAGKKPLKKLVVKVEEILTRPGMNFVPQEEPQPAVQEDFCAKCGTALEPGGRFCPKCGHRVGMPVSAGETMQLPAGITMKEYLKNYAGPDFARRLRGVAILGYVCAGINAVVCLLGGIYIGLLESAILLGLTLGMQLGKSKGCGIGILVYSILSTILGVILYGTFGGWLWIATGIYAVIVFSNEEKRFKERTAAPVQQPYTGTYGK